MKRTLRNIIAITAISFIIAVLFVSCSDAEAENEKQEYKELEIGDTAPDFDVELLSGETVKLSDYKGKTVFVNFWATWCGPCVEEMPAIQELSEAFADELVVLAINCSEKKDKVGEFISNTDYNFSVGLDEDNKIQEKYPTTGIPYSVIIDANGIIASIHLGASGDMFPVYEEAVKEAFGDSQ